MIGATAINVLAAIGLNNELGRENDLCFKLPKDMQWFRSLTKDAWVLMGSSTWRSLDYRLLKGRKHIVLSREPHKMMQLVAKTHPQSIEQMQGEVFHMCASMAQLRTILMQNNVNVLWVIGGAQVYTMLLPYADGLYLNLVQKTDPEASVFFPKNLGSGWSVQHQERIWDGVKEDILTFQTHYVRPNEMVC